MIYPPFYFIYASAGRAVRPQLHHDAGGVAAVHRGKRPWCAYLILYHDTANRWASLAWLPLYLSVWPLYGWIDMARMEALFMFLMFAGACCFLKRRAVDGAMPLPAVSSALPSLSSRRGWCFCRCYASHRLLSAVHCLPSLRC